MVCWLESTLSSTMHTAAEGGGGGTFDALSVISISADWWYFAWVLELGRGGLGFDAPFLFCSNDNLASGLYTFSTAPPASGLLPSLLLSNRVTRMSAYRKRHTLLFFAVPSSPSHCSGDFGICHCTLYCMHLLKQRERSQQFHHFCRAFANFLPNCGCSRLFFFFGRFGNLLPPCHFTRIQICQCRPTHSSHTHTHTHTHRFTPTHTIGARTSIVALWGAQHCSPFPSLPSLPFFFFHAPAAIAAHCLRSFFSSFFSFLLFLFTSP